MVAQQRGAIEVDLFRQRGTVLQCLRISVQCGGCLAGLAQQISQVVPGIGAAGLRLQDAAIGGDCLRQMALLQ